MNDVLFASEMAAAWRAGRKKEVHTQGATPPVPARPRTRSRLPRLTRPFSGSRSAIHVVTRFCRVQRNMLLSRVCNVFSGFASQEQQPQNKEELGAEHAKRVLKGEQAARDLGLTVDGEPTPGGNEEQEGAAPAEQLDAEGENPEGEEEEEEEEESEEGSHLAGGDGQVPPDGATDRDEGGPVEDEGGTGAGGSYDASNTIPGSGSGMASQLLEKARTPLLGCTVPRGGGGSPRQQRPLTPERARRAAGHGQPSARRHPGGRRPGPPPPPHLRGDALGVP